MEFFLAIKQLHKNQSSNDRFPSNKHRFFYKIQRILLLTCSTFKPLYPGAESDPQPSTRFLQPGQCIAFNPCGIVLRCDTVLERLVILGPLHHILDADLEDDAVIHPIDLDDDAFLYFITLLFLQHALQEDACTVPAA